MMQNNTNKKVILKNCVLFTDCIKEINNTQIDNVNTLATDDEISRKIDFRKIRMTRYLI